MTTPNDTDTPRWGKIPAWWMEHDGVDADGVAVLAALATFADRQGRCWPSQTTLAGKLKRSRAWVNKTIAKLAEAGLVEVKDRWSDSGGRLSSLYVLALEQNGEPARQPKKPEHRTVQSATRRTPAPHDDTPVTVADIPCHAERQEHRNPEQNPDSHTMREREPVRDVPADWMPDADDLAWARGRFGDVDLARHVEGFVLRCQAHGYRYRGIGAAWRAWLMQDAAAGRAPVAAPVAAKTPAHAGPTSGKPRDTAAEQRLGAWLAAATQLRNTAHPSRHQP